MSKYPWDTAPDWANHAATDEDGQKRWFANKPKACKDEYIGGSWISLKGKLGPILDNQDWEQSHEERPVNK